MPLALALWPSIVRPLSGAAVYSCPSRATCHHPWPLASPHTLPPPNTPTLPLLVTPHHTPTHTYTHVHPPNHMLTHSPTQTLLVTHPHTLPVTLHTSPSHTYTHISPLITASVRTHCSVPVSCQCLEGHPGPSCRGEAACSQQCA